MFTLTVVGAWSVAAVFFVPECAATRRFVVSGEKNVVDVKTLLLERKHSEPPPTFGDSVLTSVRLSGSHPVPTVSACAGEEHTEGLGKDHRKAGVQASRWGVPSAGVPASSHQPCTSSRGPKAVCRWDRSAFVIHLVW